MSTRMRKATLRQQRRQRERERHFKNVKLCPHCGACMTWDLDHYECPNCGPVKVH